MGAVLRAALAATILVFTSVAAFADDWVAVRLRGAVLQLVDGEWQKLGRGDVVPDSRVIRTLRNGNVEFQRGEEHVTLSADTQIQIYDEMRAKSFTTVKQYFGTVTVEAEVQDVQHFAVQTHYLAAVVKGTKFTVTSGEGGASVAVLRGSVFVEDRITKNDVTIAAGQSAEVTETSGTPIVSETSTLLGMFMSFGKPQAEGKADEPDDKPGKGKSDNPGKGKSGEDEDTSGKGKSRDDDSGNSGKGKSDDNSGKGKSDDDDDDD